MNWVGHLFYTATTMLFFNSQPWPQIVTHERKTRRWLNSEMRRLDVLVRLIPEMRFDERIRPALKDMIQKGNRGVLFLHDVGQFYGRPEITRLAWNLKLAIDTQYWSDDKAPLRIPG